MNNEEWSLLFTGISAACALWGVVVSIISFNNKRDVKKIKKEIEEYRVEIIKQSDLLMLVPVLDDIKKLSLTFSKITTNNIPKKGDTKTELDYYGEIKNKIVSILNEVPGEYNEIRDILDDIKGALGYCITKKLRFNQLSRDDDYSYNYVEGKFTKVITKVNTLIRTIRFK